MSRQKRQQRINALREAKAAEKEKQMNNPSGTSEYARKKEAQKHGQHPKVTDPFKPISSEERFRLLELESRNLYGSLT